MRILLIDDDELSREVLQLLLGAEGHAVEAASSGEEALVLSRADSVGEALVVLSDMQMPGLCGTDLALALRETLSQPPRTLLAMSGSEPASGALAGYDGFLLKPFTMQQFSALVRASEAGGEPEGRPPSLANKDVLTVDETTLERLRAGMRPQQLEELFCFALADAERQIDAMRTAGSAGDELLYCRSAHSMKGSFGMLGAPELQALAASAEREGMPDGANQVTTLMLFSDALRRLRHTLVTRGICTS